MRLSLTDSVSLHEVFQSCSSGSGVLATLLAPALVCSTSTWTLVPLDDRLEEGSAELCWEYVISENELFIGLSMSALHCSGKALVVW